MRESEMSGSWLMTWFYAKIDSATAQRLRDRETNELTTTFAGHYSSEISCRDAAHAEIGNFISKFSTIRSVPVEVHNFCSEGVRA
jgi:hypothetical protein